MIQARIAETPKICLVFDTMQTNIWEKVSKVTADGISHILKLFTSQGIPTSCISALCLADVYGKAKASDYKAKQEYVNDVLSTQGFNVIVPVGAEAFNRVVGFKGMQKYLKKALLSEVYPGQKVVPLQNPSQARYDPSVLDTIKETVGVIKVESEFPELREKEKLETHYEILDTLEKVTSFFNFFQSPQVEEFAFDLETTGLMFNRDEITSIQFSHCPGFSYLIPCKTKGNWPAAPDIWSDLEWEHILWRMKELFTDPNKLIIGHNQKFDNRLIYHHWGIPLPKENRTWDTMYAAFLCDENSSNGLKELACELTDLGDWERGLEDFKASYCKTNKLKLKEFSYGMVPFDILAQYALVDPDATIRLYHHFKDELLKEEQEEPFRIIMRISWLLTRFEINGWAINEEYGWKLKGELEQEIEELRLELLEDPLIRRAAMILGERELAKTNKNRKNKLDQLPAPFVFNLGSGPQKSVLFYEVMKLSVVKLTKKGKPAVDKESVSVWSRTVPKHKELLKKIEHYGELCKFLSTYVVGILTKTVNGRIHPTYSPIGAKTGRTSCKAPNWQCIPARGDARKMKLVKKIKRMVEAPDGKVLVGADLSAVEMRFACIVSGDQRLEQIFNDGIDIHGAVAKELFDYITCHANEVKKYHDFERNSVSKCVQFLSIYGGGPDALTRKVNDSISERRDKAIAEGKKPEDIKEFTLERAKEILANYFRRYSGVDRYIKETSRFAEEHGYAVSPYGFRRRVPAVNSTDEGVKARALRQAVNATVQNPASIALLLAVCNFQEEIDANGWDMKIIGTCHDSATLEVPETDKLLARDRLLYWMTQPPFPDCRIPMAAEAEWGKSWADFSDDFGIDLTEPEEADEDEDGDEQEAA